MLNSIVTLLLTVVGVYAVSSAPSVTELMHAKDVRDVPFLPNDQTTVQNLLLNAAGPRIGAIEAGKMRIPIPLDGVLYEVIVVSPSAPRLIPASRNNFE